MPRDDNFLLVLHPSVLNREGLLAVRLMSGRINTVLLDAAPDANPGGEPARMGTAYLARWLQALDQPVRRFLLVALRPDELVASALRVACTHLSTRRLASQTHRAEGTEILLLEPLDSVNSPEWSALAGLGDLPGQVWWFGPRDERDQLIDERQGMSFMLNLILLISNLSPADLPTLGLFRGVRGGTTATGPSGPHAEPSIRSFAVAGLVNLGQTTGTLDALTSTLVGESVSKWFHRGLVAERDAARATFQAHGSSLLETLEKLSLPLDRESIGCEKGLYRDQLPIVPATPLQGWAVPWTPSRILKEGRHQVDLADIVIEQYHDQLAKELHAIGQRIRRHSSERLLRLRQDWRRPLQNIAAGRENLTLDLSLDAFFPGALHRSKEDSPGKCQPAMEPSMPDDRRRFREACRPPIESPGPRNAWLIGISGSIVVSVSCVAWVALASRIANWGWFQAPILAGVTAMVIAVMWLMRQRAALKRNLRTKTDIQLQTMRTSFQAKIDRVVQQRGRLVRSQLVADMTVTWRQLRSLRTSLIADRVEETKNSVANSVPSERRDAVGKLVFDTLDRLCLEVFSGARQDRPALNSTTAGRALDSLVRDVQDQLRAPYLDGELCPRVGPAAQVDLLKVFIDPDCPPVLAPVPLYLLQRHQQKVICAVAETREVSSFGELKLGMSSQGLELRDVLIERGGPFVWKARTGLTMGEVQKIVSGPEGAAP